MAGIAEVLAARSDEGKRILAYLKKREAVPTSELVTGGDLGLYYPFLNKITINALQPSLDTENTAVHELTHAAQDQMRKQLKDAGVVFEDAYEKLVYKPRARGYKQDIQQQVELGKALNPKYAERHQYRMSQREIPAFAVGNYAVPKSEDVYPAPAHLDATAATEFMILLDLAMRDLQAKQKK